MLSQLNGYSLGDPVNKYHCDGLNPFDKHAYNFFKQIAIQRMFKEEKFYWLNKNVMFGETFDQAMASVIDGYICKIRFGIVYPSAQSAEVLPTKLLALMEPYGKYTEVEKHPGGLVYYWMFNNGNIAIEVFPVFCSINLTSSKIRNARPLGILDKIFSGR